MATSKIEFEFSHFYHGFDQQKFFDFLIDIEWYTQSDIMMGEISLEKPGKDHPYGLGAVRKITIDKINLIEDIVGFEPPRYMSYAVREGMPVKNYQGKFFIEPQGEGIRLRYIGSFDPKLFGTNWLFKYIFRSRMKTMVPIWEKGYRAYHNLSK